MLRHLQTVQGGLCPLCNKTIDITIKGEGVTDHDHDTGRIRGVLHRSCNAAEGKIANAAARWGAKSAKYSDIIPYLKSIVVPFDVQRVPTCLGRHVPQEQLALVCRDLWDWVRHL